MTTRSSAVTYTHYLHGALPISLVQSPAAGTLVGLGTNTITVTATDEAGNSATCTTIFTVADKTARTKSCPVRTCSSADCSCQADAPNVLGGVTACDNCSGTNGI